MDGRYRVIIPREVRVRLGLRPGDRFLVKVVGNSIVLRKIGDPFKTIEKVLGDLSFDRSLRRVAENQAFRELRARFGEV